MDILGRLSQHASHGSRMGSSSSGSTFDNLSLHHHRSHKSGESPQEVHGSLGLNLLHEPRNALVDIVFVHGLGGGSRKTWSKTSELRHYWPQEWLGTDEEFQNVRIHSFGYNANWSELKDSVLDIHDFGKSLLGEIYDSPTIRRSNTRIILVGHSMGGLVIKKAFVLACQDPTFRAFIPRFCAVFFLATPHRGADAAHILGNIIRVSHGNRPYLRDLERGSGAISAINDEFRLYAERLHLWSFYESKKTNLASLKCMIVEKASATLGYPRERTTLLNADHRNVCKFESPFDPNYQAIRNALISVIDNIRDEVTSSAKIQRRSDLKALETYLGISSTPQEDLLSVSENLLEESGNWFVTKQIFGDWIGVNANSSQALWLTGNPAVGKSSLAAHVINHLMERNLNCSYYFFQHSEDEKTTLSHCLRSLAYQMILSNMRLRDEILSMLNEDVRFNKDSDRSIWRVVFQSGLFRGNLSEPLYWVIDALDECKSFGNLFPMLGQLGDAVPLRVLVTSRRTAELGVLFKSLKPPALIQEMSPLETINDVKRYIESRHDVLQIGEEEFQQSLRTRIMEKSNGCFLWVRLIMAEFEHVFSEEEAMDVLQEIPADMDALYCRIVNQMSKLPRSKNLVKSVLAWVVCAVRPLRVAELAQGLEYDTGIKMRGTLERLISTTCAQLIHVDHQSRVQMIHETARDFLLDHELDSEFAINKQQASQRIAKVCLKILGSDEMRGPRSRKTSQRSRVLDASPFVEYACKSFSEHLNQSHSDDDSILELLHAFLSSNALSWIEYVSRSGDLNSLIRASKNLKGFLERRAKHHPPIGMELYATNKWVIDISKVSTRFNKSLISSPSSVHWLIPPFCPTQSAIFQKYASPFRGLAVNGLSNFEWNDLLACIEHRNGQTLAVHCSDTLIAVGLSTGRILLHHKSSCQLFQELNQSGGVRILELGLTAKILLSCGKKTTTVWDLSAGQALHQFQSKKPIVAAALSERDSTLTVATKGNLLTSWSLSDGTELECIQLDQASYGQHRIFGQAPTLASISPEQKILALVYRGQPILLWDISDKSFYGDCDRESTTGSPVFHCAINAILFHPNPKVGLLVATYQDAKLAVYDVKQLKLRLLVGCEATTLAFSPDGSTLATGNTSGVIQVFDFSDPTGGNITLLYQINANATVIQGLAFSQDNVNLLELRSSQCNVWEPQVLVRKSANDATSEISSDVAQEPQICNVAGSQAAQITAVTLHTDEQWAFCGKDDGSVAIYDAHTGQLVQELFLQSKDMMITLMQWGRTGELLATVDHSSRLTVRRINYHPSEPQAIWTMEKPLFDMRIGEAVHQFLLNDIADKMLVSSASADTMWSIVTGQAIASIKVHSDSPRRWINHPRNPQHLVCMDDAAFYLYDWTTLRSISNLAQSPHHAAATSRKAVKTALTCGRNRDIIATLHWDPRKGYFGSSVQLWPSADIAAEPERELSPLPASHQLSGVVAFFIGVFKDELLFISKDLWICATDLANGTGKGYWRYFFLPEDWLTDTGRLLCLVNGGVGDVIFAKEHELAVIKRGLEDKDYVQF